MGNQQGLQKPRERADSSGNRHSRAYTEDECPVQVKIAKGSTDSGSGQFWASNTDTPSEFPVVLKWNGGHAKKVEVSGSWDGWRRRLPLVKSQDDFTTIISLAEGKHEFKFLVDGNWVCDSTLQKTDNNVGGQNNVLFIDRMDFEVFDALDKDMLETPAGHEASSRTESKVPSTMSEKEMEKNRSYTQTIPDRHEFERTHHPPVLPPHLLQVILNKDTPVSCDPNVLPEPNHVMLNHLYALSIKDGVMVLSATHRYRKKYVTTLLYKPIN